ncbi:glycine--tRNA ligase-like protein [Lates japonicus]|uniref:Glycine--tRNA ligase-like protein n=1 Tax=Lates japonicus TaxID=270547 RepID=A0AAD3R416_LATJO|nr:glycine--tRNA ligase-like protein [Lates japonicus]
MLLRSAASALLRTSTEISSHCPVFTVRFVRLSLRYPPLNRPFSTSVCLCKKKQKSLWLQLAEGQTMDGNVEEILAPLRLAVKEQGDLVRQGRTGGAQMWILLKLWLN